MLRCSGNHAGGPNGTFQLQDVSEGSSTTLLMLTDIT